MKTLSDVMKEIDTEVDARFDVEDTKMMRRVCEAMAKEIVPEIEEDKYNHERNCDCPICQSQVSHNATRDKLLKNIERFMGETKGGSDGTHPILKG